MRKILNSSLAIAASVLLAFSMSAMAQNGSPGQSGATAAANGNSQMDQNSQMNQSDQAKKTKPDKSDEGFLKKAAQGGKLEVELAPIAEQNAQSQEVKDFAKRMLTDHGKANEKLQALATKEGITVPDQPSIAQRAKIEELKKRHGAAFDKAYMSYMVKDHTNDVNEFKTEAYSAHSAAVRDWVSNTLPTLESHLKEAKSVDAKVKNESASKTSNGSQAQTASNTHNKKY